MRAPAAEPLLDAPFVDAFEAGRVAPEAFTHREHVRLTWACLRAQGLEAGGERVAQAIRRFAGVHAPGKYHETITRAWVLLVWRAIEKDREAGFEAFLESNPDLADKRRLSSFYRPETLAGAAARAAWVEPDLRPFP